MPRRGGSKGRGSGKRNRPQANKRGGDSVAVYTPTGPIVRRGGLVQKQKLKPMVLPTGSCPTGKLRYYPESDAQLALERAQHNRKITAAVHVEDRYYPVGDDKPCECGGFHLTSKKRRQP